MVPLDFKRVEPIIFLRFPTGRLPVGEESCRGPLLQPQGPHPQVQQQRELQGRGGGTGALEPPPTRLPTMERISHKLIWTKLKRVISLLVLRKMLILFLNLAVEYKNKLSLNTRQYRYSIDVELS